MAPCLLSVASSGKTVVSPDGGLRSSLAHITEREGGREEEEEEEEEGRRVWQRSSAHVFVCVSVRARLCELYSSYESHSVGGYNASAPSTTNVYRLTLFQVYNHIPYGVSFAHYDVGPPLCIFFFYSLFLRERDMNGACGIWQSGCFIDAIFRRPQGPGSHVHSGSTTDLLSEWLSLHKAAWTWFINFFFFFFTQW